MGKPQMPFAQIIYGEVVYWLCVVAALVCSVGPLLALYNVDNNVLNPHYLFSAIWQGLKPEEIWAVRGGTFPGGHFWLKHFTKGDGFTHFGLVLGCAVALPALLATSIAYLSEKPRQYLWVAMGLWVSALITFSVIGVVGAGH